MIAGKVAKNVEEGGADFNQGKATERTWRAGNVLLTQIYELILRK